MLKLVTFDDVTDARYVDQHHRPVVDAMLRDIQSRPRSANIGHLMQADRPANHQDRGHHVEDRQR